MVYTEVKERNRRKYYYRVISIRKGNKISKKRKYLGLDLKREELHIKEKIADKEFGSLLKNRKKELLEDIKKKIIRVLKKNKIKRAGIFGSYARGEAKKNSDIDILVKPSKGMGFDFVGIKFELEDVLKTKVDLINYKFISPYIKKDILDEEIRII